MFYTKVDQAESIDKVTKLYEMIGSTPDVKKLKRMSGDSMVTLIGALERRVRRDKEQIEQNLKNKENELALKNFNEGELTKELIKPQVEKYLEVIRKLTEGYHGSMKFDLKLPTIVAKYGSRYVAVIVTENWNLGQPSRRIHSFVDIKNGNILKAATFRAPARNGVRGNIFSADVGRSVIDWHGAKYLK